MTHLRQRMLDELQRRNYSQSTASVATSTRWRTLRSTSIARPSGLAQSISASTRRICFASASCLPGTIEGRSAALRFLFVKTLRRPYLPDHIPFPKRQRRLPTILRPARGGAAH